MSKGINQELTSTSDVKEAKSKKGQGREGKVLARPQGRPTRYTEPLANEICARIIEGQSLRKICRDDNMPSIATIFNWHGSVPGFLEQYTRAKSEQADTNAEDIQELADDVRRGRIDPQAARVAGDLLKWSSAKLKPKKYGDRLDIDSKQEIKHSYSGLSDEQLNQVIAQREDRTT